MPEDLHELWVVVYRVLLRQDTGCAKLLCQGPFRDSSLRHVRPIQTWLGHELLADRSDAFVCRRKTYSPCSSTGRHQSES